MCKTIYLRIFRSGTKKIFAYFQCWYKILLFVYFQGWYKQCSGQRIILASRSAMILFTAHEQLGCKHVCASEGGRLLDLMLGEYKQLMHHPIVRKQCSGKEARYSQFELQSCAFC